MRVWEIGFPTLLCLVGALVLRGYTLDARRMNEVLSILRLRQQPEAGAR